MAPDLFCIRGSLGTTAAVIVVAISVDVSGVVAVRHTGVRRIIIPIAAAKAAGLRFNDATPFLGIANFFSENTLF